MSALLRTLGAFGLILVLSRLRVPLAVAILIGAAVLGLAFQPLPLDALGFAGEFLEGSAHAVIDPSTVGLLVITAVLLVLSSAMREGGQLERIVGLSRDLLRRPATTMMALPALIGLLPMPGGALFSAPMVEAAAGEGPAGRGKVPGALLSAVNYWFRHPWEYWWPLYPGVIWAIVLTKNPTWWFIVTQAPLTLFMLGGGLLIVRQVHPDLHAKSAPAPAGTRRKLLWATSSIWLIIVLWVPAAWLLSLVPESVLAGPLREAVTRMGPIAIGLLVALLWTARLNRQPLRRVARSFATPGVYQMVALVLCVMIFKFTIDRVEAATRIGEELQALHIPPVLVFIALPFIAGMVTGLAYGFVSTTFPILLGILTVMPDAPPERAYMALAYAMGHVGQMLSPLHMCHVMSNQYFRTPFGAVYRYILPPAVIMAVGSFAYFLLLRAIL